MLIFMGGAGFQLVNVNAIEDFILPINLVGFSANPELYSV